MGSVRLPEQLDCLRLLSERVVGVALAGEQPVFGERTGGCSLGFGEPVERSQSRLGRPVADQLADLRDASSELVGAGLFVAHVRDEPVRRLDHLRYGSEALSLVLLGRGELAEDVRRREVAEVLDEQFRMVGNVVTQRIPAGDPDLEKASLPVVPGDLPRHRLYRRVVRRRGHDDIRVERRLEGEGLGNLRPQLLLGECCAIVAVLALALHASEEALHPIGAIDVDAGLRLAGTTVQFRVARLPEPPVDVEREALQILPSFRGGKFAG
jgi:hypothetical protein